MCGESFRCVQWRVILTCTRRDLDWLLAVSSQFARVVKGVDLRSTARKCAWARTP